MDGSERLWDYVQQILPNSSLTATELTSELGNYQDKLLNLFQHKVAASSSRLKRAREGSCPCRSFSSSSPPRNGPSGCHHACNCALTQGPDAAKRQQIRSGRVQTLNMELNLDYDAKTRLVGAAQRVCRPGCSRQQ